MYSISLPNAEGFRSINISLSLDSLARSDAKYAELDVSVDTDVINLVPPTSSTTRSDEPINCFCFYAGGSSALSLLEDIVTELLICTDIVFLFDIGTYGALRLIICKMITRYDDLQITAYKERYYHTDAVFV